jgi:hypothetical protein
VALPIVPLGVEVNHVARVESWSNVVGIYLDMWIKMKRNENITQSQVYDWTSVCCDSRHYIRITMNGRIQKSYYVVRKAESGAIKY